MLDNNNEVYFEKISTYKNVDFDLPKRSTELSAGYDFIIPETVVVPSILKNWFSLIKGRLSSPEFDLALAKTELSDFLISNPNAEEKTPKEQEALILELLTYTPELLELLKDTFSLTLSDMKSLASETRARATLVPTGVKAKLKENQKLELLIRSSTPFNSFMILGNGVGLIDADYYNNDGNEGHIFFQVVNLSPFDIVLEKGDIVGQGVISTYDIVDGDNASGERDGGIGSTDK